MGGCRTLVFATLSGTHICDCNTLTKHLVVTVHQYFPLAYSADKP
jgi:hypothetical protein